MFLILKLALIQSYFCLLRNTEVYAVFRKLAILSEMNPFHTFIPYLFKIQFIFPLSRSHTLSFPLRLSNYNFACISQFVDECCMFCSAHDFYRTLFGTPNSLWWRLAIIMLSIIRFFPSFCYFRLSSHYSPEQPVLHLGWETRPYTIIVPIYFVFLVEISICL
jgi:hypothetical protein